MVHGVDLPAGDIDILLKDRAGIDAFSVSLSSFECLTTPQFLEGSKKYFSAFRINGVEVEFSTVEGQTESETHECTGSGPWVHYKIVSCGGHQVPVVCLELRLITEWSRHRPDRSSPIIQFMQSHGFDRELLARRLKDRGFSEIEQVNLLKQIDKTL